MRKLILFTLCLIILLLSACTDTVNPAPELQPPSPPAAQTGGAESESPTDPPAGLPTDPPQPVRFVTEAGERWKHVLYGGNGEVILLDIPTDREYSEYVSAVWDKDTNDFIEGWEQIRAAIIDEAEQAYEFNGSSLRIIPRTGFHVTLTNFDMDAESFQSPFDWLFYSVTSSTDKPYVLPSEWQIGDSPAPLSDPGRSALYVSTALGVWRVTADGHSKQLTSDEYEGNSSSWHESAAYDRQHGMFRLFWTANAVLSPDKRFIIFRTNRDCYDGMNMSVWRIDLHTDEEQRILDGNAVNVINGFVTDRLALIDERFLLDVQTGAITSVTLPDLPNRSIVGTGYGYIVCESYREEDAGLSSLSVYRVEPETGALTELFTVRGVFRGLEFSPSGKFAYALYGTEPNRGAETLMLFDFDNMTTKMLEDLLGEAYQDLGGTVSRASWLTDASVLLNIFSLVDGTGVYLARIASW